MAPNDGMTGRTEMVGVSPKQNGRVVVADEDVSYFEAVGWAVVESTDLPLSGINVPGKVERTKEPKEPPKDNEITEDELKAKINKANTTQLKALAIQLKLDVDLDEFDDIAARREIIVEMLGLTDEDAEDEDEE
jgi:hypothetical protein